MRSFLTLLSACLLFLGPVFAKDKMYIGRENIDAFNDQLHVHMGHNVYIETKALYSGTKGLYTFKEDIVKSSLDKQMGYEKTWKCPYCHYHWKFGERCQNPDCPTLRW